MTRPLQVAVVGSWHQSSVLSACLAELGHRVVGIAGGTALSGLRQGRAPIFEPGLDEILTRMIESGRLTFTGSFIDGLAEADVAFVAIDTPVDANDDSDLTPIWRAVNEIRTTRNTGLLVVITAQVPVGTTAKVAETLGHGFKVAYVPEFLRLGTALDTFRKADRFVVGADDHEVASTLKAIYKPLDRPIYVTDIRSAEMAKHASNAWLATSISFINQVADLCEQAGADVNEVAAIMKLDGRVGPNAFLNAGVGYAGGTLGREIRALQKLGASSQISTELFDAVDSVNQRRLLHVMSRVRAVQPHLDKTTVAVFGLTYKPETSTLRRSASLSLIRQLAAAGARVSAYDPLAKLEEGGEMPHFTLHREPKDAIRDAGVLILMTRWPSQLAPRTAAALMAEPIVVDTGNHLDRTAAEDGGLVYSGIGR